MTRAELCALLDAQGVEYELFEHPPAYTVEDILSYGLPQPELGAKNLFLRDKKKRHYCLLVAKDDRPVSIRDFEEKAGLGKLSFASEEDLMRFLGLTRGAVTPFGVLNDATRTVRVFLDRYFEGGRIAVHPCENTATVYLRTADLVRLLREHGSAVEVVEL